MIIGCVPKLIQNLEKHLQVHKKQYGIKYFVIGTIRCDTVDALSSVATNISKNDPNIHLRLKLQVVVISGTSLILVIQVPVDPI